MKMTMMKWAAAGIIAAAPAIGLARVHHVSAAAPLVAVSSMPVVASALAPSHAKAAAKPAARHKKVIHKRGAAVKRTVKKVVKHTATPKVSHKRKASVKAKKH